MVMVSHGYLIGHSHGYLIGHSHGYSDGYVFSHGHFCGSWSRLQYVRNIIFM